MPIGLINKRLGEEDNYSCYDNEKREILFTSV